MKKLDALYVQKEYLEAKLEEILNAIIIESAMDEIQKEEAEEGFDYEHR